MKHTNDPFHDMSRELVLHFLAELLSTTQAATTPETFQRAFQAYFDELHPWLTLADAPLAPRPVFPLFDEWTMDEATDVTRVRFSPKGEAFFRAWVRRQAVLADTGLTTDPGQSHEDTGKREGKGHPKQLQG
jgi:hypothetical protein